MPVILRVEGFKFFFYSNEGVPPEPIHIHVRKGGLEAKFWLTSQIQLARNDGFDAPTLRRLANIINEQHELLIEAWYEYFTKDD